jgi:EpsI family protein
MQIGAWEGTTERLDARVVTFLGLDDWLLRQYRQASGAWVGFYVGFGAQPHGGKVHHSPEVCYLVQGWRLLHKGVQQVSLPGGNAIDVYTLLVQKGVEQQWVLYWPQRGTQVVTARNMWEEYRWKLTALWRLTPVRTDKTLVLVAAPVTDSREEARGRAIAFIQAVFPLLSDLVQDE